MGGLIFDPSGPVIWGKLVRAGETYEEQNREADKREVEEQAGPEYQLGAVYKGGRSLDNNALL